MNAHLKTETHQNTSKCYLIYFYVPLKAFKQAAPLVLCKEAMELAVHSA